MPPPCFSSDAICPERDSGFFKTYAADGGAQPLSGGTPFRQLCPAYPSPGGRQRRDCFSEGVPTPLHMSGNVYLNSSAASLSATFARAQKVHRHRQARLNSRNLSNITTSVHSVNHAKRISPLRRSQKGVLLHAVSACRKNHQPLHWRFSSAGSARSDHERRAGRVHG